MNLQSALDLKAELLDHWQGATAAVATSGLSVPRRTAATAIGVYPLSRSQFGITVGARNRVPWVAEGLLNKGPLTRVPRTEKRVHVTGRVVAAIGSKGKRARSNMPPIAKQGPRPGDSIGHHLNGSGTLGCYLRSPTDPEWIGILSNNHVLAYANGRTLDDTVIAPGASDRGCHPPHGFGSLREYAAIDVDAGALNEIDAADATFDGPRKALPDDPRFIPGLGLLSGKVVGVGDFPKLLGAGSVVSKRGRTTGDRKGSIKALNVTVPVNYPFGGVIYFDSVLGVQHASGYQPFARQGDSGSLLVVESGDRDPKSGEPLLDAVGLIFAVTTHRYSKSNPALTYALPLEPILTRLGVGLY